MLFRSVILLFLIFGCKSRSGSSVLVADSETLSKEEKNIPVGIMRVEVSQYCRSNQVLYTSCSGSRVGKNLVLTAEHCVGKGGSLYIISDNQEFLQLINTTIQDHRDLCGDPNAITTLKSAEKIAPDKIQKPDSSIDLALLSFQKEIPQKIVSIGSLNKVSPNSGILLGLGKSTCVGTESDPREVKAMSSYQNVLGKSSLNILMGHTLQEAEKKYPHIKDPDLIPTRIAGKAFPCGGDSGGGFFDDANYILLGVLHGITTGTYKAEEAIQLITRLDSANACAFLNKHMNEPVCSNAN